MKGRSTHQTKSVINIKSENQVKDNSKQAKRDFNRRNQAKKRKGNNSGGEQRQKFISPKTRFSSPKASKGDESQDKNLIKT